MFFFSQSNKTLYSNLNYYDIHVKLLQLIEKDRLSFQQFPHQLLSELQNQVDYFHLRLVFGPAQQVLVESVRTCYYPDV